MPENTTAVTRPGAYGNRFRVVHDVSGWWCMIDRQSGLLFPTERGARRQATLMFREEWAHGHEAQLAALRGRNVACFCRPPPDGVPDLEWCHGGVLLEIANA